MVSPRLYIVLGLFALLVRIPGSNAGGSFGYAQVTPVPYVVLVSPHPGEALQGVVDIMGRTSVAGFRSAEILFGYANDPSQTWFFITESTTPVDAGFLAKWDTSTLTDGNYILRLVVNRTGGSPVVAIVSGLRVRNYSPVETSTPTPVPSATALTASLPGGPNPTFTELPPATTVPPTITPLPTNPAALSQRDISSSLLRGAAGTGIALAGLGLYLAIRKLIHR